jgi:poly-gamma-glutamate capsule biosynthesis protein CapA/YwtB (metallophosphatase superfamily)
MSNLLMGFVGDVLVNREKPLEAFRDVRGILSEPGILFANLEGAYADNPDPVAGVVGVATSPAHNLDAFAEVGFSVLSMANNHVLDGGYEAMLENRSRLRARGVLTCGAGECLADAREPAIIERDGLRVAFLAYACVFPMGHEARADKPGLAPMRAYNYWREALPTIHTPGMFPLVMTVPDQADLTNLAKDIRRARERADLVITSFHWGDQSCPYHLTDHETRTARYCIDQGADLVVGHHHHAIRGMEWYKGKPIMYGLGHFVFDYPLGSNEEVEKKLEEWDPTGHFSRVPYPPGPRDGWPLLPLHEDTRMTVMAWATADRNGVREMGFLPCRITSDGLVHPLELASAEGREVIRYVAKCNKTQRLNGRAVTEGARLLAGFETLRVVER